MKTDSVFYRLFQIRPQLLFDLLSIDLIESIMVYKFPQKSRQEVAQMLGVEDLKQTRFYQEVFAEGKEEGKEEVLSNMIKLGMNLETIAQCLDLPLETVRQKANQKDDKTS